MANTSDIQTFVSTGATAESSPPAQDNMDEVENILPDSLDKSVSTILSRYSKHGDYNFGATIENPFDVYYLIDQMKHFNKLDGYYGFHATFSLKLVWNCDPFVQGIYMLAYLPPGPLPFTSLFSASERSTYEAVFFSGCPRTIFNINTTSSAQLDIPYIGPDTFVTFGEHNPPLLGHFYIVPLSPARGPTCFTKLGYTAYFALKNLRTIAAFPHSATLGAQTYVETVEMQAPEAVQKTKQVSTFLGSTKNFLDSFGAVVPSLSSVTQPVSWLFGGAAKIADFLGYAKPFSINALQPRVNMSYVDTTTADSTFTGAKMAMNSDAGLMHYDLSGHGVDEMNISTILSRPEIIPRGPESSVDIQIPWSSETAIGTVLNTTRICPDEFRVKYKRENGDMVYVNTHMSYLSTLFAKWRGSIRFSLMFASTSYQTGRLRIVYTPASTLTANTSMLPYCYSQIVDISDPKSWDFEIPFISPKVWHDVNEPSGTFQIIVERPLLAACSVLQDVNIVLLVSAGKTFEFALPRPSTLETPTVNFVDRPADPAIMQSPYSIQELTTMLSPDQGLREFETEEYLPLCLSPAMETKSTTAHKLAIGDPVRSLRAVIKKFWVGSDPVWKVDNDQQIVNYPLPVYLLADSSFSDMDMISRISVMYTFWRGGFRFFANNYFPTRAFTFLSSQLPSNVSSTGQGRSQVPYENINTFAAVGTTEASKFELPYSYGTAARNIWFSPTTSNETMCGLCLDYYAGDAGVVVSRAVADDFQFGYLIGAPVTLTKA